MDWWDIAERTVKIVGIISGVAAVVGVYIQLNDINAKQRQKTNEDWQSSVVYKIIESRKSPIAFSDISIKYTSEAQKFPQDIPREKLDDAHLQLVLINLIQSQAIVEPTNGIYAVRTAFDPKDIFALTFKMTDDANRQMALHTQLAYEQLSQSTIPLTQDQLRQRTIAAGGDRTYLTANLPMLLQQMQIQHQLKFEGDGRISIDSATPQVSTFTTTTLSPSPDVGRVLPKLDSEMMRYVMLNDVNTTTTTCYNNKNPDGLQDASLLRGLEKLDLVTITELKGEKNQDTGKPCSIAVRIENTGLLKAVQNYYFEYLQLILKSGDVRK
jgi:hypothetical protein